MALEQLFPSGALLTPKVWIEIEFGSQTVTIPESDLDTQPKAILIADTIDGKPLSGDAPYWFVAKSRYKGLQKVTDVESIIVR